MKKFCFITILICLLPLLVAAQFRLTVNLNDETIVEKETISLGDLGQISGNDPKLNRLKEISLGYSPRVGLIREIPKIRIAMAIAAAGFSKKQVVLKAPNSIIVRRAGQMIHPIQIRDTVEKAILDKMVSDGVEARIVRLDVPQNIEAPIGKVDIRVILSSIRNMFAPFSAAIEIRVNDRIFRRQSASVEIEAFTKVYVLRKDLKINTRIAETDVTLEHRRIEKPLTNYLRNKAQLKGKKVVRDITTGSVLTSESYVADIMIKAGDLVRIEGRSGRLKIVVNGKAQSSGRIGDRIAIKNLQSNNILQAIVVDEGLVKVSF